MKKALVLQINGKEYRAASLEIRQDGSFYFFFPKKQGYYVHSNFQPEFRRGMQTVTIKKVKKVQYFSPYVSFHPGSMTIHLNAYDKDRNKIPFYTDSENIDLVEMFSRNLYQPLFSVVLPDLNLFDEYNKRKIDDIIFTKTGDVTSVLQLEFFLQGDHGEIDDSTLIGAEHRRIIHKQKLLFTPRPLAICLIVSTIKTKGDTREIVCQICQGKTNPKFFTLRGRKVIVK